MFATMLERFLDSSGRLPEDGVLQLTITGILESSEINHSIETLLTPARSTGDSSLAALPDRYHTPLVPFSAVL